MKVVSFVSLKGGTSKSTLARHVAVAATQAGHSVVVMDCDQQATLRDWGVERGAPPEVIGETSTSRRYVELALDKMRKGGTGLVVIDTPGSFEGGYSANAISLADYIVVPCRPSGEDTATFWETEAKVTAAGKPFGAIISQAPTTTGKPAAELMDLFFRSGVRVCPVPVHTRQFIANSYAGGKTVFEIPPLSASDRLAIIEMKAVWEWIADNVGMRT
jgi:chromosome partitioning protein